MNILVICDDFWHPGEIVERGLKPLEQSGCCLDVVMYPRDMLYPAMLRDYDVIINAKSNVFSAVNKTPWFDEGLTQVMPNDFREYIEEGHGFIALHAGTCYSRKSQADMASLIGLEFVKHPPQCDVTFEMIGDHPIVKNIKPYTVRDEHYCVNVFADDAETFMTGTSATEAGTQKAGYTRQIGKGRLCVLTPGHNYNVFTQPEYQKIIKNAVFWCAGRD